MSLNCTGPTCPIQPTTRIDTIASERGSGAFQTRRVEKQDEKTWWEHDITVRITFCDEVSRSGLATARDMLGRYLNSRGSNYRIEGAEKIGNDVVEVKLSKRDKTDPAAVEQQLNAGVKSFLEGMRDWNLSSAKFDFSSNEKKETKNYDVWSGVDRMG